jgi:hypothetical protein
MDTQFSPIEYIEKLKAGTLDTLDSALDQASDEVSKEHIVNLQGMVS